MTQSTTTRTPAELFADLPSERFASYGDFETTLVAAFNAHAFDFPAGYGWRDALRWAIRHGVVAREGDAIVIAPRPA